MAANPARQGDYQGWLNRISSTYNMIASALTQAGQAVVAGAQAVGEAVVENPGTSMLAFFALGSGVFF